MKEPTAFDVAQRRLSSDLGLPAPGPYSQDWVYEIPEAFRASTYFDRYLTAYEDVSYGSTEKHLLMQLMLDIVNDFIGRDSNAFAEAWGPLRALLKRDHASHAELIQHWALPGDPIDSAFALTPFIRDLQAELER